MTNREILTEGGKFWTIGDDSWNDDSVTVAVGEDGARISVAEEKAVDSYNSWFQCSFHLTEAEAISLTRFLISTYPEAGSGG